LVTFPDRGNIALSIVRGVAKLRAEGLRLNFRLSWEMSMIGIRA